MACICVYGMAWHRDATSYSAMQQICDGRRGYVLEAIRDKTPKKCVAEHQAAAAEHGRTGRWKTLGARLCLCVGARAARVRKNERIKLIVSIEMAILLRFITSLACYKSIPCSTWYIVECVCVLYGREGAWRAVWNGNNGRMACVVI